MKFVLFYHSLLSDWNHGNAHFLRGIASDLIARGHEVRVYEPEGAWSLSNLLQEQGEKPIRLFHEAYPNLRTTQYAADTLDLGKALAGADVVIVHEWNEAELVARIGRYRRRYGSFALLFHDTHHRSISDPSLEKYDLSGYDGVLAFGKVIRDLYLDRGWHNRAWTWHEAADVRLFRPLDAPKQGDLVWVGNWGDGERTQELQEYLLEPACTLGLKTRLYGVRYPAEALAAVRRAGARFCGWAPNFLAPQIFARHRVTVHVPRRPYVEALPGIPTIRVFEALACGIPLICAPWEDAERLFTPGADYLIARGGRQMKDYLKWAVRRPEEALEMAAHGLSTILARHTCTHRVDELLGFVEQVRPAAARPDALAASAPQHGEKPL